MSMNVISDDLVEEINVKLKELFDLISKQSGEMQNFISDAMIEWCLNQFLPSSQFYEGIAAYAGVYDDGTGEVIIAKMHNIDTLMRSAAPVDQIDIVA